LIAETVQGVTPDLASLSSARLFSIIDLSVERGGAWAAGVLAGRTAAPTHTEAPSPSEDQSPYQDSEPDEVCLVSFSRTSRPTDPEVVDFCETEHLKLKLTKPPSPSCGLTMANSSLAAERHHALLSSLCRLTC
jgi:hypothetical protein